jgi:cytochrome P450 family 4
VHQIGNQARLLETVLQEKVLKEQQEIFGDSQRLPTYREIQQMKYLEMVIKETLRLYPTVPLFGRKLKKDFDVGESNVLLFDRQMVCVQNF